MGELRTLKGLIMSSFNKLYTAANLEKKYNRFIYKTDERGVRKNALPTVVVVANERQPYGSEVTPLKESKDYKKWSHYGQVFLSGANYPNGTKLYYDNEGLAVAVVLSGGKVIRFFSDKKYFKQLAPGWRRYSFPDGLVEERYAETGYGPVFKENVWRPAGSQIFKDRLGRVIAERQGGPWKFYFVDDPACYKQIGEEEREYYFDDGACKGVVIKRLLNKAYPPKFLEDAFEEWSKRKIPKLSSQGYIFNDFNPSFGANR